MKRNIVWAFVFAALLPLSGLGWIEYYKTCIPSHIQIIAGDKEEFDFSIPANAEVKTADARWNLQDPFTLTAWNTGSYEMQVRLFGWIPLKTVQVEAIEEAYAIPCGCSAGIYMNTDGVMVIDTGKIPGADGVETEPSESILQPGDYIKSVNGETVSDKEALIEVIKESAGEDLCMDVQRKDAEIEVKVKPVLSADGSYKAGIWVRDDLQGIGTLTYIMGTRFGALGHGVNDVDTGELIRLEHGELRRAGVLGIVKGSSGTPGSVTGCVDYSEQGYLGEIQGNSESGITGIITEPEHLPAFTGGNAIPIALKQEIRPGTAWLHSDISGEMKDYEIEITKVNMSGTNMTKGLEIRVTDPELLNLTGGIIQGMSGSPILQDGKFVGAVTHVFVNDPTRGYGIFIENML